MLWCIVCRDADTGEVTTYGPDQAAEGVSHLLESDELIGHNIINYDLPVLAKLGYLERRGNPTLPKLTDTLVMSRLIHTNLSEQDRISNLKDEVMPSKMVGSHSLKAWGHRLDCHKGDYLEEHGFDHFSEGMLVYCIQDTEVTYRLYHKLNEAGWDTQCLTLEHKFAACMGRMERYGFAFDVMKARELYADLSVRKLELNESLQELFPPDTINMKSHFWVAPDGELWATKKAAKAAGIKDGDLDKGPLKTKDIPFNPGSRDHIADRLKRLGWVPTDFTNEGKPKMDESVLSNIKMENDGGACTALQEYLMLIKRMGQLGDGNQAWMKLEKNGRLHGRVNPNGAVTGRCTHSNPNVAQVPRVGSPFGRECRSLFKATKGRTLVGCDASGLELRCLAHFLAPFDEGDYAKKLLESDIHVENQKAAGLPSRDAAKTFIYAFLYGAGDEKIGEIIGKGRGAGRIIKKTFLESLPALAKLKACISNVLSSREFLKGLDGRHLYIRSEHAALNTLLQSAGAVIMKQATIHLYEALTAKGLKHGEDWGLVAHVHDEFQVEVKAEGLALVKEEAVLSIRKAGETLAFKCPLDGEAHTGINWAETH
jgi:DNA polymerase-1